MPYAIITIPFNSLQQCFHPDELNIFCLNKKVVMKKVEFFCEGGKYYWSVFIEYEPILQQSSKEGTKSLNQEGNVCFARLKNWRKEKADKEGIPPYVIASNQQLIEIINKEIITIEGLKQVHGFGKKKLEKYGKEMTEILKEFFGDNV